MIGLIGGNSFIYSMLWADCRYCSIKTKVPKIVYSQRGTIFTIEMKIRKFFNTINRHEVQTRRSFNLNVWKNGECLENKWIHLNTTSVSWNFAQSPDPLRLSKVNGSRENQFVCRRFGATLSFLFPFHFSFYFFSNLQIELSLLRSIRSMFVL